MVDLLLQHLLGGQFEEHFHEQLPAGQFAVQLPRDPQHLLVERFAGFRCGLPPTLLLYSPVTTTTSLFISDNFSSSNIIHQTSMFYCFPK